MPLAIWHAPLVCFWIADMASSRVGTVSAVISFEAPPGFGRGAVRPQVGGSRAVEVIGGAVAPAAKSRHARTEYPGEPQALREPETHARARARTLWRAARTGASLPLATYTERDSKEVATAMTTFDNRRDAFENKFAHDETLRFKATARRNKMLGLWVAEQLGKTGAEADAYAKSVVAADFEEAGDGDVVRKVRVDLEAAGHSVPETTITSKMTELLSRAVAEIEGGR
jgi:hypothetical protein